MARKKTSHTRLKLKTVISHRLKEVRQELFGEHGGPELARRLNLPARTWYNYETGVTVPAEVLLAFIDQTGVNPVWLLSGEGPRYRRGLEDQVLSDLTPQELIRRGLEKLEERDPDALAVDHDNAEQTEEFVTVGVVNSEDLAGDVSPLRAIDSILVYHGWLKHPKSTVALRVEDDAMHPILPIGSMVAVDCAIRSAEELQGRIVAARVEGRAVIRWLELSGRHLILRPNRSSPDTPTVAIEPAAVGQGSGPILGQVVWSWSRFS
ncbi:helix-turn-helix domain-containing protein [Tautonia marina]|uniref:helix-turn-helix domain-containing protein n=1 Tax=Tautonia marina TaxID=2653855 RepID=UPI001260DAB6|nr:S24 family peptidase [Tautonia marina]